MNSRQMRIPEQRKARREPRALELLRAILDPKQLPSLWSATQAAWYLIGIYIDDSDLAVGSQPSSFAWLPNSGQHLNSAPWIRDMEVDDELSHAKGFCTGDSR